LTVGEASATHRRAHRPEKFMAGLDPAIARFSDKPMRKNKEIERRDDSMRTIP
jgi:hypothetical protein